MAPEPDDDLSREELSLGVPTRPAPGPAEPHAVSVADALSFAVDGPRAKRNLLVASAMLLVPVVGYFALQGFANETERRLLQKDPSPAPRLALRDLFHHASAGTASGLVELLGLGVLTTVAVTLAAIANASLIAAGLAASSPWLVVGVLAGVLLFSVVFLGSVTVVYNSMLTRAELTGRVGEALALGEAWREARPVRRRTFVSYLVFVPVAALLLAVGASFCGVGLLPALVLVKLSGAHLRWQLYEQRLFRGGPNLAALPPAVLPSERPLVRALPHPERRAP